MSERVDEIVEQPGPDPVGPEPVPDPDREVKREMARRTRRSFLVGGVTTLAGLAGWRWLTSRRDDDGVGWPFRRALEVNEGLAEEYFSAARLAPTYAKSMAKPLRFNGDVGLGQDFDASQWTLRIEGIAGGLVDGNAATLTIEQIRAMPRYEMVTEFKCIEGWSNICYWAGARLADVIRTFPPPTVDGTPPDVDRSPETLARFVSMETPDSSYYVGLDMASALHPQTLLAYELNGEPLAPEHGAPLRLAIPVKYGIKNIKRVGVIRYTDRKPRDFWGDRGYDWYAGH